MAVTNTRVRILRHETNQRQHITNKRLLSARLRELDPATLPLMPAPNALLQYRQRYGLSFLWTVLMCTLTFLAAANFFPQIGQEGTEK